MGMQIGAVSTKGNTTYITLKNKDGSTMGTLAVTKATRGKAKKKKLTYNFKRVSNKIMSSKTSSHASKAVREARSELVQLLMKQKSGDYDEKAVTDAIAHARSIERVAKKHRKHIEEEERAQRTHSGITEEENELSEEEEAEGTEGTEEAQQQQAREQQEQAERTARELEQLALEIEQMIRESEEQMNELADELMSSASYEHMDDDDIENMKKRHRAEELRDIMEADMKYLKALFDRLSKEKQANESGAASYTASDSSNPPSGVSLQLAGVDVPVEVSEAPVPAEGANVDVTL